MILTKIESKALSKSLLIWSVLFALIIFGFSAVYPQMHNSAMKELLDTKLGGFSPALLKTFNLSVSGESSFMVATGFFAYYFQYLFLAAAIYAMMIGSQALIKEETDGTIEYLYAQPITRKEIVTGKLFASIIILVVFWLITALSSLGATLAFKQAADSSKEIIQNIVKIFSQEALIIFFFLALGFLLSTLLKSSKQSMSLSLGIVFAFYLIGIFSDLNDSFSWAKNFSPIHMGIPSKLISENLSVIQIMCLILCSVVFLVGTYVMYQRKDLKI
ncbi:ABC transporter permease subunit [Enterococcus sp. LJL99]